MSHAIDPPYPHGLIQAIRGMCTDEAPYPEIDQALVRLDGLVDAALSHAIDREQAIEDAATDLVGSFDRRADRQGAMTWFVASWVVLATASWVLRRVRRESAKCRLLLAAAEASARAAAEQRAAALETQNHVQAIIGEWETS